MTDLEKADDAVTAIMDTMTAATEELEALKDKLDALCEQIHDACQEVAQLDYEQLLVTEVPVGTDVKIIDGEPWVELGDDRVRFNEDVVVLTKSGCVGYRVRGTHIRGGALSLAAENGYVYLLIGDIVVDSTPVGA